MKIDFKKIKSMPKTDLHLHLDGSLRISSLIRWAKEQSVKLPSYTEEGLKELVFKDKYENLGQYLEGFKYTTSVMQNEEVLEEAAYELVLDNFDEGVRYIEVRFAPQLHQSESLDITSIIKAVNKGLKRGTDECNKKIKEPEPPFAYGIIACSMRMFTKESSPYFNALIKMHPYSEKKWIYSLASQELVKASLDVRDKYDIPLVGCDLAGMEFGYPAEDHKVAFELAQKGFLNKTVHAGEAFGPESIYQAINYLYADRIGHGMNIFEYEDIQDKSILKPKDYVNDLVQYIAEKRITLEICLSSNMQTNPKLKSIKDHPLKKMLEKKLSVSICTDNRTVSNTSVSKEYQLAQEAFNLSVKDIRDIVSYGFKRSFFSGTYIEKRAYVKKALNYFDMIFAKDCG